jgi:hypothetical protein
MIEPSERMDRVAERGLFVAGRQYQGEKPVRARVSSPKPCGRQLFRAVSGMQHPPECGGADAEQSQRDDHQRVVEDVLR